MQYINKPIYCLSCGGKLSEKQDDNNKIRHFCPACGWTYYANPIPAAACVVLNSDHELLLIKRKNEPKPGSWALPSGYVEINETAAECAVHELEEETGLLGNTEKFLGHFFQSSSIYKRVITFGFLMKIMGGNLKPGDDALDARYFPMNTLPEIPFTSHIELISIIKKEFDL